MNDEDLFYRIGKIAPKPGEVLVLKTEDYLSMEAQASLRQMVTDVLARVGHPEQPVMILHGGLDLLVIDTRAFGPPKAGNEEHARQLRQKNFIEHFVG